MLEEQWRTQRAFTERVIKHLDGVRMTELGDKERTRWTKEYVLSLMKELGEVLDCLNWKHHRTTEAGSRTDILEEFVDIQKFLWGLMILWGVTPEELAVEFDRKTAVVEQRWRQEHELPDLLTSEHVALVDIDGVLSDYPACFIEWAVTAHPGLTREQVDKMVDPLLWERLKHEYRASGAKRALPVKDGARDGLGMLKEKGYTIMLLSNRPVRKYSRLIADTIEWLHREDLEFDHIYWADFEKYMEVIDRFPSVKVAFDDDVTVCGVLRRHGIRGVLISGEEGEYHSLLDAVRQEA